MLMMSFDNALTRANFNFVYFLQFYLLNFFWTFFNGGVNPPNPSLVTPLTRSIHVQLYTSCHGTLQEPGTYSTDDVRGPSQHGDQPVPDAASAPSHSAPTQARLEEPRHDDGRRQRGAHGGRGMPASVPTSTMELFGHGRVQSRRLHFRQNTQERQVDRVYKCIRVVSDNLQVSIVK